MCHDSARLACAFLKFHQNFYADSLLTECTLILFIRAGNYIGIAGPDVIKLFFMHNSTEHEVLTANKN